MAKINEKIKHYREARGIGIGELALVTNVPYSNIKSFEEGTLMPSLQVLKRISEALNIDYKELNMEEDKKEMIKDTENKKEMVNHPSHYNMGKYECIEVVKELVRDMKGIEPVLFFNAFKYLWRYKQKNGLQDLEKCEFYLKELIKLNKIT